MACTTCLGHMLIRRVANVALTISENRSEAKVNKCLFFLPETFVFLVCLRCCYCFFTHKFFNACVLSFNMFSFSVNRPEGCFVEKS